MKTNILSLSLVTVLSFAVVTAQAGESEINLRCVRTASESCEARTYGAFAKLGCHPKNENINCEDATTSPSLDPAEINHVKGVDFCTVTSNCSEPDIGNFGQVSCPGTGVDLRKVDNGLALTTSVGLFRHFVTILCK